MNVAVQRLNDTACAALLTHFVALPAADRRLRFGSSLSLDGIAAYVDTIHFDRDAVFAVYDDHLALTGVAHVAFGDDHAELGLSVLPARRGQGVGSALFGRASAHVRNRFVSGLFMHCLKENAPIMRIARRFGMEIVTDIGDADAHLELPPASPASITEEFIKDKFAFYDYALKAHVARWKSINAALLGTAPTPRSSQVEAA